MTVMWLPDIPGFMADGLCAQTDPEIFFPEKGHNGHDAQRVCRRCPVRDECLAYALDRHEEWGVWGGTTPTERREMWKRRRPVAA